MSYIMAITIGPVQDFIATARRSRDLWFGSWILSELSKAAAKAIAELYDEKALIFPTIENPKELEPNSQFNVVNKILAVVDDPKASGKAAHDAVQERLTEIRELAFNQITDTNNYFGKNKETARKQVDDMIEFYWAASPFANAEEYSRAREKAELLLIARKTTRNFNSATWSSNAPKSALDGQRESVIDDDAFDIKNLNPSQLRRAYNVRPGERLCGVGLLKRNGNRGPDDSFFSTSHVASLPLLERLKTDEQKPLVTKFMTELGSALHLDKESAELGRVPYQEPYKPHEIFSRRVGGKAIGYDGHSLFFERLSDFLEDKSDEHKAKSDLTKAKNCLIDFLENALDGERPSPYYALLLADGDSMGDAINGLRDPDSHRRFSEKLSRFAKSVSKIVIEKHKGSLVYAGGDDVLAFLPLHTVIQCSRELADSFRDTFKRELDGVQPTLSVGIAIAHHIEPLQDALALVRTAEQTAKRVDGKNALAIILSKRSGFDTTIKGSWKPKTGRPLDYRLIHFARLHMKGDIPDSAAYELRDLQLRLNCDTGAAEYTILQEATSKDAVRILGRKQIKDTQVTEQLTRQFRQEANKEPTSDKELSRQPNSYEELLNEETSVGELANELIVARELARAFQQAGFEAEDLKTLLSPIASGEPV